MKPNFYSHRLLKGIFKNLLSFFFLCITFTGFSQKPATPVNAYYLSKELYTTSREIKRTDIGKDSIAKIAQGTLAKLYYYAGTDEPGELQKMIGTSPTLDSLLNRLQKAALFCQNSDKIKAILSSGDDLKNFKISELIKKHEANKNDLDTIKRIERDLNTLVPGEKNGVLKFRKADSPRITSFPWQDSNYLKKLKTEDDTIIQFNYDLLVYMLDSLQKITASIHSEAMKIFDTLSDENKTLLKGFTNTSKIESFTPEFRKQFDQIQQQDAQITVALLESSAGSVSGWNMPSEAEMIDAVATYIASRVKQETVLWFFDKMRQNTERYELILTAFPETMNLLQSSEVFEAPNMGSAWKYALSKDFVHLPKNILTSEWIKERIPEGDYKYLDLAAVAWEISELVDNRLSYRDLLKQLYLNHGLDEPKENMTFPDSIIRFLYSVSNELYVVNDKDHLVRNLTYEEIASMPFNQLEMMLELLNVKYHASINNLFLDKLKVKITKDDKQKISKWIGNSLLALSQFDKILQQIEDAKKGKDQNNPVLFDGYSVWKLISQVVESAIPLQKKPFYQPYINRANDAFEIYHLLSEKNYSGAVSKTLELVDSLIFNEYLIVDQSLEKNNSPFLIAKKHTSKKNVINYRIPNSELSKTLVSLSIDKNKLDKLLSKHTSDSVNIELERSALQQKSGKEYLSIPLRTLKASIKDGTKIKNRQLTAVFKPLESESYIPIDKSVAKFKGTRQYILIHIHDLDKEFTERGVKPKKFPRVARYLKKGTICMDSAKCIQTSWDKEFMRIQVSCLKDALKQNECKRRRNKLDKLFEDLNDTKMDSIIRHYYNWSGTRINDSLIKFPINSIAAQALISPDKKAMQMIMRLASFLNDVASTNNEKELKKVINSYALPPGSYKQKRNAWHSLTLNAFAGPYAGYETAGFCSAKRVVGQDTITSYGATYGISAPIGITYTKTFGKRIFNTSRLPGASGENPDIIKIRRKNLFARTNFSLSVSMTFIDLGAVVSYRMSNTEKVLDQSFKWEQFISPGLNVGISIPKTPLMVQMGYQYTPKIRRLDEEGLSDKQLGMWRAYAGIFFDIPLVNLWMKTRSVKYE